MKKGKSKTSATKPITSEAIVANIDMAQRNFNTSKTSASEAAVYAYLVWRDTTSTRADPCGANWIKAEIEKRNDEIIRNNKAEEDDRERAEKFALGRLKQQDLDEAEQQRLRDLAALDDEVWKLRLKVLIKARDDASAFTEIVKFVFRFDSPADASNTSRYAAALEWIDANCAAIEDASGIVRAIADAGGFDKVIHMQRLVRKGPEKPSQPQKPDGSDQVDSEDAADMPETLDKRKAWQSAPSLASFELPIEGQSNDLILFLGRYTDGKVDVVSPVPLAADKLDSVIERLGMPTVLEADQLPDPVERIAA